MSVCVRACTRVCLRQCLGLQGHGWEVAEPGRAPNPGQLPPCVAQGSGALVAVGSRRARVPSTGDQVVLLTALGTGTGEDGRRQPAFLKFLGNFDAAPPHRSRFSMQKTTEKTRL